MQFDRRKITNGLAWAGAALIVAIPAADLIARQFSFAPEPQVAVVQEEPARPEPDLPTASTERPAAASPAPATTTSAPRPQPTPAATVPAGNAGGDAVDNYLQSGRELPSYISGGNAPAASAATSPPANAQPTQTAAVPPQQTQPAAAQPQEPSRPQITPPRAVTGFPTPVSERPRAVATQAPIVQPASPPLIVNNPGPVVTAEDLENWETGPLSDFLANRNGQRANPPPVNYDNNGFWLDQGPNSGRGSQFPQAYDDDYYYYPYGQ